MIVPDINLLLYVAQSGYAEHERALAWWEGVVRDRVEVGLALPALLGFLRIGTDRRFFDKPIPIEQAARLVEEWLELPNFRALLPGARHVEIVLRLMRETGSAGKLVADTHLAAIAIEHGAELYSNDRDFARFPGLRWVNPLAKRR